MRTGDSIAVLCAGAATSAAADGYLSGLTEAN